MVLVMPAGAIKAVPVPEVWTDWLPLEPILQSMVWPTTSYMVPE